MGQPFDAKQAFFYGQFVQAAYTMFRNQNPDPLRPEPAGIPEGWELGAWIHMSDFILSFKEPEFYGIVVHGKEGVNDPDSRIIAIRGTEGAMEWIDDAAAIPIPFRHSPSAGRVATGFDTIYSSLKVVKRILPRDRKLEASAAGAPPAEETFSGSFAEQLEQLAISREVERGVARFADGPRRQRPTVVSGHSLGGALSTLFVMENAAKNKFDVGTLCTFASPRVGNKEFARVFDQLSIASWRIANTLDLVPKLPPHIPVLLDYDHVDTCSTFSSEGFAKNNPAAWHAMDTYLDWLERELAGATALKAG